jgi:phage-related minor tail protein
MKLNSINTKEIHVENVSSNQAELKDLGSQLNGKTSFAAQKEALLTGHIESIAERNNSWIQRLSLSLQEKSMLDKYYQKQQQAVEVILDHQNASLVALCSGQVAFVKEVVNTLLKTGRAGLKAGSDLIFMDYRNQRAARMEILGMEFYDLMERKLEDAERRSPKLQELKLKEVAIDLKKWEEDYQLLQDEFSNILTEQV